MSSAAAATELKSPFTPARTFALATGIATLALAQQWALRTMGGDGIPVSLLLALTFPFWYLWALLSPVVAWLARRLPIERGRVARRAAAHAGSALGLSALHTVMHVGLVLAAVPLFDIPIPAQSTIELMVGLNWVQLTMNLLAYAGIFGATQAIDFRTRLRERELQASQLSEQLAQARLHALRMQLNPHFLFNAMNTISMLVRKHENDEAVRMLAGLSDLLRYVLEETRPQEVTLAEELEFVERYLGIEQVRFHDRLQVRINRAPELLDARVPNLILQPLVENAIQHGITQRVGAGRLEVEARRDGDKLVLTVSDDGPGVAKRDPEHRGVGLENTSRRLTQLYGAGHALDLRSSGEHGARATIRLPLRVGEAPGDHGAGDQPQQSDEGGRG